MMTSKLNFHVESNDNSLPWLTNSRFGSLRNSSAGSDSPSKQIIRDFSGKKSDFIMKMNVMSTY